MMMKHGVFILIIPLAILSSEELFGQRVARFESKTEVINDDELRILSWNIQMLPRLLFRISRGPIRRSKLIPRHIIEDEIDLIVFQEAFDPRARRLLRKRLKDTYPFMIGPANSGAFRIKTNSGIWMLSKIPIAELGTIDFKDCQKDDCLARKGALLVEAEWQGVKFQVLGTHLEAGGPDWIKKNQYHEIRELLTNHQKPGIPQFLCGDFNTDCTDSALYSTMLDTLSATDGVFFSDLKFTADEVGNDMNVCPPHREPHCKIIDYILYRGNGFQPKLMERYVRQYKERWDKQYQDLSDHNAVFMKVVFR